MKRLLNATAVVVASSLLLAACGGGSDDETVTPPPTTTPEEPMPDTSAAYESAIDAEDDAADAAMAAANLLKGATDASKAIGVVKVNGDSQMAYKNAMIVLETTARIEAERKKAADAVMMVEGIDQTDLSDQQMARIGRALTDAKASLKAIDDILMDEGAGSLMMAVEMVKDGRGINDTDSKIAQYRASQVAGGIKMAIDDPADTVTSHHNAVMVSSNPGSTFMQIAGSSTMTVNTLGEDFTQTSGTPLDLANLDFDDGARPAASYMGILGDLVCVGPVACSAATDGKITGNVQFVPDEPTRLYHKIKFGGDYVAVTDAGSYGYWLNEAGSIVRHVNSLSKDGDDRDLALLWNQGEEAEEAVKATYAGMVGGYSHRTIGEDDEAMSDSGEFTANVNLTATFKETNASISGTVSGFAPKDGSAGTGHVNGNWRVALPAKSGSTNTAFAGEAPFSSTDHTYRTGEVGATDGSWTAVPYGEVGKHPTGFVGTVDATFEDGVVTGVYQAD